MKVARLVLPLYIVYDAPLLIFGELMITACALFFVAADITVLPSLSRSEIVVPAEIVDCPLYTTVYCVESLDGVSSIWLDDVTNTVPPLMKMPPSASSHASAPDSDNRFLRGFGLEASFGVGIGGASEATMYSTPISTSSLTLIPRVDAVWHLLKNGAKFGEQKFVMHFMTGFELPIFIPLSSTGVVEKDRPSGTRTEKYRLVPAAMSTLNVGAGFDLKLTDKLDLVADISVGIFLFNINAGIVYRLN